LGFTKKAISVGLSATMLATLLATAFAGSAFAISTGDSGTYWNTTSILEGCSTTGTTASNTAQCSQIADGSSTIAVFFGDLTAAGSNNISLTLSGGGYFVQPTTAVTGWVYNSSTSLTIANGHVTTGDYVLVASGTAGTTSINVGYVPTVGQTIYGGVYTVSFVSAAGLALNVAGSYVGVLASGTCEAAFNTSSFITSASATAGNPVGCVGAWLTDGNGNAVVGASVTFTITPVGLVGDG
jgi:hypothetical protein